MLHAAFLDRGDSSTVEARCGQAACLVLRVVDLVAPDPRPAVDPAAFRYQHKMVERYVDDVEAETGPGGEVTHLRSIAGAAAALFEARGVVEREELRLALHAYSINRKDVERHDEAIDVLDTASRVMRGSPGSLSAGRRLGEYLTWAGRVEAAAALYRRLGREPWPDAGLVARLGGADVLLAAGDAKAAERRYRRVAEEARRADYVVVEMDAELGLVRAQLAQGRAAEAAVGAWRLHERHEGTALPELGAALETAGALDAAARVQAIAAGHPQPTVRWGSVASLVRIAVRQGDRLAFERWRRVGELFHEHEQPSPSYELDFWLEVARGAASFAGRDAARGPLATARAVAARAAAQDAVFRVRAAEVDVEQGRRPEARRDGPPADAELGRVIEAVAVFGRRAG